MTLATGRVVGYLNIKYDRPSAGVTPLINSLEDLVSGYAYNGSSSSILIVCVAVWTCLWYTHSNLNCVVFWVDLNDSQNIYHISFRYLEPSPLG